MTLALEVHLDLKAQEGLEKMGLKLYKIHKIVLMEESSLDKQG
jgi:hypothetical protein